MSDTAGNSAGRESVADRERRILAFWESNGIFEKSEGGIPGSVWDRVRARLFGRRRFVFYDGPPFATGLPHYGHILASAVKDAIPRYKTMRGFAVRRRWGWDCHGLPLEVEMEKEIGSKSKKDIEAYGIEKFNAGICGFIFKYADEWKKIIPRIGRWVDMENDYRTVNTSYIESVWSVFHRLYTNGFVSRGFKSLHICPRCATTVSNTEVADSYEMLTDTAVFVAFPLKDEPGTNLVAWTTTPWTLFGNVALGVGEGIEYAVVESGGARYVVHENALHLFPDGRVVGSRRGADLVGREYVPPFDYLYADGGEATEEELRAAWRVYAVPYIDISAGTGIVHLAPAYGADDLDIARENGLPVYHHVTADGVFADALGPFAGLRPKEKGNPKEVDGKILAALRERGVLVRDESVEHSYPVCWRCATPLLNYATDSWFVHADRYRDRMVAENRKVGWVPEHIRDGRFGHWLENAQPWAVSRSRFWGAPLPVWRVEKTGEYLMVDSLESMVKRMRPKNTYSFVRHGFAVSNETQVFRCNKERGFGLTEKGVAQAREVAERFRSHPERPTVIFHSPLTRARETAEYIARAAGAEMIEDPLLIEIQIPELHDRPYRDLRDLTVRHNAHRDMYRKIGDGESHFDVFRRLYRFLERTEREYEGAHIVVVTHKIVVACAHEMARVSASKTVYLASLFSPLLSHASVYTPEYRHLKRTERGEIDLHRPFIDGVVLYDDDGNPARHVGEVFDCWFESGAMPYGSHRYPFIRSAVFDPVKRRGFPADFICEGLDQTRGWFYSLLAISVGAFGVAPFRQVIATGIIRAADGKKMSKRLKNYSDPMDIVNRYGADSLRHYLLGSPVVRGEALDFRDAQVDEIYKKVYTRLHNCLLFYTAYGHLPHADATGGKGGHPLDRYILARLAETHAAMTAGFESYRLDAAVGPIGEFVDDLSTWYVRRSRDRIRYDTADGARARATLRFVLTEFAKCIAPVAPFCAEHMITALRKYCLGSIPLPESVHLCRWPRRMPADTGIITAMDAVRGIVSSAHEQRLRAGIKIRQPLGRLVLREDVPAVLRDIIADEVHVKEVVTDPDAALPAVLDVTITPELRAEGFARACIRTVQNLRKERNLSLTERLSEVRMHLPAAQREFVRRYEEMVRRETRADAVVYDERPVGSVYTVEGTEVSLEIVEHPEKMV